MIVLYRSYGGYSNRLFQNLHLEAFCLDHDIPYANPTLADIRRYYVSPAPASGAAMAKLLRTAPLMALRRMCPFGNVVSFGADGDHAGLLLAVPRERTTYVEGWRFRVFSLTETYQDVFSSRYSLREEYISGNETLERIGMVDRDRHAVVAVHVRHTDYAKWRKGAYWFDDEVYTRYMDSMAAAVESQTGKRSVFVVCSDESTSFTDSEHLIVSRNPWYVDHCVMSRCDYIIGPPSTFSAWASYVGRTKYLHFTDGSGEIDLSHFGYCTG